VFELSWATRRFCTNAECHHAGGLAEGVLVLSWSSKRLQHKLFFARQSLLPRSSSKSFALLVPVERIELPTFGLQNRCSTAELNRLNTLRASDFGAWFCMLGACCRMATQWLWCVCLWQLAVLRQRVRRYLLASRRPSAVSWLFGSPAFPVFEQAGCSLCTLGMGAGAVSVTVRGSKLTVEERGFPKAVKGAFSNARPMEQVNRWAGRPALPANQPKSFAR
jgi:hypothetical protein